MILCFSRLEQDFSMKKPKSRKRTALSPMNFRSRQAGLGVQKQSGREVY